MASAEEIAVVLENMGNRSGPKVETVVRDYANLALSRIKANAKGRPGPRIVTGDYYRSWNMRMHRLPFGARAVLGTNLPQGRRLEYGFWNMTDSLGRTFRQPAYPHVKPAMDSIAESFPQALIKASVDEETG